MDVRNLILYYGAGWKHTLEEVHDKDSSVREAEFDTSPYIPKDVNWLLDQQAKDMDLYSFSMVGCHALGIFGHAVYVRMGYTSGWCSAGSVAAAWCRTSCSQAAPTQCYNRIGVFFPVERFTDKETGSCRR